MGSEWTQTTLGELSVDVSYGYTESASSEKIGPRFLRITDIQNGVVDWRTVPYCPITEKNHSKYRLHQGDIVVARTGNSTGENYFFNSREDAVFASYLIRFKIDKKRADSKFVWYAMRSPGWWAYVNSSKTGSAQAGANAKVLGGFRIYLPPLHEQRAIAHILGTLDDRIELNRRMNETLEAMAQALFKSWFVDFDPVIDNALASGKEIPEELRERAEARAALGDKRKSLPEEIRTLFPHEFTYSEEMGWIPKGWELRPLYNIAKFINGTAFKSSHFSDEAGGLPIIKIAEIKNGVSSQTKFTVQSYDDKYLIKDGEILFSWSGNPDTSIDTFVWTGGAGWLNQHIFKVSLKSEQDRTFVYYQLKYLRPVFAEIARDKQTTGLGHVTAQDMKNLMVVFPGNVSLTFFNRYSKPIFDKWYSNQLLNITLSNLRDTLLPKLLSGELRIPDAEKMMEDPH